MYVFSNTSCLTCICKCQITTGNPVGCHGFTISIQYDNYHACLKTQLVTQPFSEQRKIILDIVK